VTGDPPCSNPRRRAASTSTQIPRGQIPRGDKRSGPSCWTRGIDSDITAGYRLRSSTHIPRGDTLRAMGGQSRGDGRNAVSASPRARASQGNTGFTRKHRLHKETQASQGNTGFTRKHRLHKEAQASQGNTGFTRKHRLHKETQASQGNTGFTRKHRLHKETQAVRGPQARACVPPVACVSGPVFPPYGLCFPRTVFPPCVS
jgi:hypothetical protein